MQIEGKLCPYCHTILHEADQAVACSACGLAHHLECWNENQGCTTYGCQGKPLNSKLAPEPDMKIHTDTSIRCPSCGSVSSNFSRYCFACGSTLVSDSTKTAEYASTTESIQGNQNFNNTRPNNSYAPPNETSGFGSQTASPNTRSNYYESSRLDYYSVLLKHNQAYYMEVFQDLDAGRTKFNWAAFFLGVSWLAYRKMILQALLFSLITDFTIAIFTESAGFFGLIFLGVVLGIFGNILYKKSIDKKIDKLQASVKTDQEIRIILSTQKDASIWYAVLFIFIYAFANSILHVFLNSW